MASTPEDVIKQESKNYSRMAALLNQKRSPEEEEAVRKILNQPISIDEKIRRIETLNLSELPDESPEKIEAEILRKKKLISQAVAQKNSSSIRVNPQKGAFFTFLLKDFPRIRDFGRTTGLIQTRFIPPAVTLERSVFIVNLSSLQKYAFNLIKSLEFLSQKGWMVLSKFDYNLSMEFKKLCDTLIKLKPEPAIFLGPQPNDAWAKLETSLFLCMYMPEYPEIILSSLKRVMEYEHRTEKEVHLIEESVRKLIFSQNEGESLQNIILAINMVRLRRFLKINDLTRTMPGGVISQVSFNAPPDVQQSINLAVSDTIKKWQACIVEKAEIDKIRSFIDRFAKTSKDGGKTYNFQALMDFYEAGERPAKYDFNKDKDDLNLFTSRFFRRFMKGFEALLIDKIEIKDFGIVKSFSSDIFQVEWNKLELQLRRYEQFITVLPRLTRNEFLELKQSRRDKPPTSEELTLLQQIDKFSEILLDIGRKLGHISVTFERRNQTQSPDIEPPEDNKNTLGSSAIGMGTFQTPFWNKEITTWGYLRGKTFAEAVETLATLCLNACLFFYDPRLYAALERDIKISRTISETKKLLERIADTVTYEKINRQMPPTR